jgi:hypothetical protein
MACRKYLLTNNTSSNGVFSYQECSNQMWNYNVLLPAGESCNIWLIDGTYFTAMPTIITVYDFGSFPFVVTPTPTPSNTSSPTPTPTNTSSPTQTPTPTQTETQTPTPTQTETQTQTPTPTQTETQTQTPTPTQTETQTSTPTPTQTETPTMTPTNTETPTPTPSITPPTRTSFSTNFANNPFDACGGLSTSITLYGVDPLLDQNIQFYDTAFGPNTGANLAGFYASSGTLFELDSNGVAISPFSSCNLITQTPTPTNTNTPTVTPTNTETPTNTPSETPTNTPTETQTPTPTETPTNTPSETPTNTPTETQTPTPTETPTNTPTETQTPTPTQTETQTSTPTPTQTETPTMTPTNTETPTPTPTETVTPTPSFAYYTYSLGSGATVNDACVAFASSPGPVYGSVAGGIGPNINETLYSEPGVPPTVTVPDGYYSNGTAWYQVTGGLGQITASDPNGCL